MNDQLRTIDYGRAPPAAEQRNRVLRNTYWLLALSMLPTVLGAWLGVATGITRGLTGGLGLIVFLGGAFGLMFAIERTKNSAAGVPVLLGDGVRLFGPAGHARTLAFSEARSFPNGIIGLFYELKPEPGLA